LNFAIAASEVNAFLNGSVNTRELWRGTGIREQELTAFSKAAVAAEQLKTEGKIEGDLLELLAKGWQKAGDKGYGEALQAIARTQAGKLPEWQYLLQYTIGKSSSIQAEKNEKSARVTTTREYYLVYRNDRDEQFAEECFSKAIKLNPEFSPSYAQLAECLECDGRFAEALEVAEKLLKLVPRCATAYKIRGKCYDNLDRQAEALTDFKTAAELGPSDPETYRELAQLYSGVQEYSLEVASYEKAIALKSAYAGMCYWNAAECLMKMGKYQRAINYFEHAKKLGFDSPMIMTDAEINKCLEKLK
jgi:tetratricopeptide (TPR) repeat protein